jgi:hypothetical protein
MNDKARPQLSMTRLFIRLGACAPISCSDEKLLVFLHRPMHTEPTDHHTDQQSFCHKHTTCRKYSMCSSKSKLQTKKARNHLHIQTS